MVVAEERPWTMRALIASFESYLGSSCLRLRLFPCKKVKWLVSTSIWTLVLAYSVGLWLGQDQLVAEHSFESAFAVSPSTVVVVM